MTPETSRDLSDTGIPHISDAQEKHLELAFNKAGQDIRTFKCAGAPPFSDDCGGETIRGDLSAKVSDYDIIGDKEPQETIAVIGDPALTLATAGSKNALRDEELEFIIHTRDNNKPNLYGSHSQTTGKLAYPEVARLYNEKYGRKVGPAAVEKRYRTNLLKYYAAHPDYPQKINYAAKTAMVRPKLPAREGQVTEKLKVQSNALRKIRSSQQPEIQSNHNLNTQAQATQVNSKDDALTKVCGKKKKKRHISWRPAEGLVETTSLEEYVEDSWKVQGEEHPNMLFLTVVDGKGSKLGIVAVPTKHLRATSELYVRQRGNTIVSEITIQTPSELTVERYVRCISPTPLSRLPQHDFVVTVTREPNRTVHWRVDCTRIDWDFNALLDLYLLASEMSDNVVRDLVFIHWRHTLQQVSKLELDRLEINRLFEDLPRGDPAQKFWAHTMYSSGLSDRVLNGEGWTYTLVEELENLLENGPSAPPWEWDDDGFYRAFHLHKDKKSWSDASDGKEEVPEHSYSALAQRLLAPHLLTQEERLQLQHEVASELIDRHEDVQKSGYC